MFNRREQQALCGLAAALLVGSLAAVTDYFSPSALEDFRVVPRAVARPPALDVPVEEAGPLSLNKASASELEQLPSIGPKTAARIIALRLAQGPFARLEQLRQVKGIGAQTLEKLRPLLKLE